MSKVEEVDRALELAGNVANFVENWSDCARHGHETPEQASDRYSEAARCCHELAAEEGKGKKVSASPAALTLLAGAGLLNARGQELRATEEPKREAEDRAFDDDFLDPAKGAAEAAVEALCALAEAWLAKEAEGDR